MPARWKPIEESVKKDELTALYVNQNKSLGEIAKILKLAPATVYDRLIRLNIPIEREKKLKYNNKRHDVVIPDKHSAKLAEFIGIMLGDGNLTPTQVAVTLGTKDVYADHVVELMAKLFAVRAKTIRNKLGHQTVYFGSVEAVRWLKDMGLVHNKVKMQVDIPGWIFKKKEYMRKALRGLIDTDGSIYKLRWGRQISFCNHSLPLLRSVRRLFVSLGFDPSQISGYNIYLTKKTEIDKFHREIGFKNGKHLKRFLKFGQVA